MPSGVAWPLGFIIGIMIGPSGIKSKMTVRYSGAVPGARGGRARQETVGVVNEVGDDHVNDLLWKSIGRGRTCSEGSGGAPPKSILPILARSRYQIIFMNSSITAGAKNGNQ